ncbi:hypothetical protein AC781_03010 [Akkermansia glycaniphila]|nr:hypothetical protein AC781_03010 [Akkermansia glycaniphila]
MCLQNKICSIIGNDILHVHDRLVDRDFLLKKPIFKQGFGRCPHFKNVAALWQSRTDDFGIIHIEKDRFAILIPNNHFMIDPFTLWFKFKINMYLAGLSIKARNTTYAEKYRFSYKYIHII